MKKIKSTSFAPAISNVECAARFLKTLPKTQDGKNSCVSEFMFVAHTILTNYHQFTLTDFMSLCKGKELPPIEIQRLFNAWTIKLIEWNKLNKIQTCYDEAVFEVV